MTILVLVHSVFRMWNIPSAQVERLIRMFPQHVFLHAHDDAEGVQLAGNAEIAFSAQITREQFQAAPHLRWIHSPSAGIGGMLFPEMVSSAVTLTNSRGISAETIAEHILAVTLALFRRLPLAFRRQEERRWAQDEIATPPSNRTLGGSRVAIVGLGAIGSAAALRLHALGAHVTGVRRRIDAPMPAGVSEVRATTALLRVLTDADVVVLAAPQTQVTRGLIGPAELAAMKPGAVLVNISRGALVDEAALAEALRSGHLGGAALDVFRHEPLAPDSPLWNVPNLIVTPHTSGFRHDHWDAVTDLFAENLRRFDRGERLLNVVDKEAGY